MADRDCKNCKNYKISDSRSNWNGADPTFIYSCSKWKCEFEPKTDTGDYPRVFSEAYTVNGKHIETHYWRSGKTYWEKSWIDGEEYRALRISKERFEDVYDNRFEE